MRWPAWRTLATIALAVCVACDDSPAAPSDAPGWAGAARPSARRHSHDRLPSQFDRRGRTRAPRARAKRRAVHGRVRAHCRRRPPAADAVGPRRVRRRGGVHQHHRRSRAFPIWTRFSAGWRRAMASSASTARRTPITSDLSTWRCSATSSRPTASRPPSTRSSKRRRIRPSPTSARATACSTRSTASPANNRGDVTPLLTLDRYPDDGLDRAGEPGDLPLAWTRAHGQGRVFYTALGHRDELWLDAAFQRHVVGGLRWALGR